MISRDAETRYKKNKLKRESDTLWMISDGSEAYLVINGEFRRVWRLVDNLKFLDPAGSLTVRKEYNRNKKSLIIYFSIC